MKTFLVSVKASSASGPSSQPRPDCLNPPNGVEYRTEEWELTERLPDSTPRATRSARPRSRVGVERTGPGELNLRDDLFGRRIDDLVNGRFGTGVEWLSGRGE